MNQQIIYIYIYINDINKMKITINVKKRLNNCTDLKKS